MTPHYSRVWTSQSENVVVRVASRGKAMENMKVGSMRMGEKGTFND